MPLSALEFTDFYIDGEVVPLSFEARSGPFFGFLALRVLIGEKSIFNPPILTPQARRGEGMTAIHFRGKGYSDLL